MRIHRLIMLIIFVGLLGLWTVWQQVQTVRTGYRCDAARKRIETLRNEKAQLEFQVARLRAPEAIMAKKAAFQICVGEPTETSLVTAGELQAIVGAGDAPRHSMAEGSGGGSQASKTTQRQVGRENSPRPRRRNR